MSGGYLKIPRAPSRRLKRFLVIIPNPIMNRKRRQRRTMKAPGKGPCLLAWTNLHIPADGSRARARARVCFKGLHVSRVNLVSRTLQRRASVLALVFNQLYYSISVPVTVCALRVYVTHSKLQETNPARPVMTPREKARANDPPRLLKKPSV